MKARRGAGPLEQALVALGEAASAIHDQKQPGKGVPPMERIEQHWPVAPFGCRRTRVAVSRQIYDALCRGKLEEVEQSRAARRLAGARQPTALRDGIDRTRFTRVGATRESDFGAEIGRKLCRRCSADQEKIGR